MKKILATILSIFIFSFNSAFAEGWVFTAADKYGNNQNSNPNSGITTDVAGTYQPYQAVSTPEVYYGSVNTNEVQYNPNNPNNTNYSPVENESFSQRHPILTGIGVGALVLGAVALTALTYDDEEQYHHHPHHHDKHRNGKCDGHKCKK